jgi:ABC-2 type transport system permease protein
MLFNILFFELRYRLNRPATYIYFGILFFIAFLFESTDVVQIGGSQGSIYRNSPYTINQAILVLSLFAAMICSAIMGVPVYRDFEHRFHEILFTTPISKLSYLLGRFLGSYLITIIVMSGLLIGIMVGASMPYINPEQIGPFNIMHYWQPFATIILPNVFFMGAIFFMIGALTRNIFAIYVQGILFLVLYLISNTLTQNIDNQFIASLLDPIGLNASSELTKFWTPSQRNEMTVPLKGDLLYNRLLWVSIGMAIFFIGYQFFSFSAQALSLKKKKTATLSINSMLPRLTLPVTNQKFNLISNILQFWSIMRFEMKQIYRTPIFIIIIAIGVINTITNITANTEMYGIYTFPTTVKIIQDAAESFFLYFIIIITFYTGELVWRERTNKINQITDALPVANITLLTAKFFAMISVLALINLMIIYTCAGIQFFSGYNNYEMHISLKHMFLVEFPVYVFLVMYAFFIHSIVNNKFLGHAFVIITYITNIALEMNGFENKLYLLGEVPSFTLSDMNGFGHFLKASQWFQLYWIMVGIVLLSMASLIWVRGTENNLLARIKLSKSRFNLRSKISLLVLLIIVVACGSFISYHTKTLHLLLQKNERRAYMASFERKYKKFENLIQPRIMSVNNQVDIFPDEKILKIKGQWWLKNIHQKNIDTIILNLNDNFYTKNKQINFSIPTRKIVSNDSLGFYVLILKKSLLPGDSMHFTFNYQIRYPEIENEFSQIQLVDNGTFFNSQVFPSFGYNADLEIIDNDERKKENLPHRKLGNAITDSSKYYSTYISNDADWIKFETTVSTVENQIAIAPGYLQKEWKQKGRRYFHYKMDAPILNFYSYLSADYQVKKDKWNDVNIEIYYQKGHEYNVDRMIVAIKHSLTYFTKNFGPYQHKQARIIEFPAYQNFAQSFPNTIPYSENIGFILNINDPKTIDACYYVTSHEIAHQWWAHQVIGSNVDGMTVMSETMAQYSALMVMKKQFGNAKMKKFLAYELEEYLSERGKEREKEQALLFNQNQPYLHYNKGSVVMYALQDLIGEDKVNTAAKNFIASYKFKGPPYPNSIDFYRYILAQTPDSLKQMVDDLFLKITVFNNSCQEATAKITKDKKYLIKVTLDVQKFYADSVGNERTCALNDWIDVGAVDENDNIIFSKKIKVNKHKMHCQFLTDKKPYKAGIDPLNQLIDKDGDDNLMIVN